MNRTCQAVALVLGLLASVGGCGTPAPQLKPDPAPARPPAAVLEVQTGRILADIGAELAESDRNGSVEGASRLTGVALEMRTAEFAMRAADPAQAPVDPLGVEFAGTAVPATDAWPRSFVAVTAPNESGAQYLYLLTQPDPRSAYALASWSRLLAGVTLPETAPPDVGSDLLPLDQAGALAMSPAAALAEYAKAKDGPDSPSAALFAGSDPARDAWAALGERWGSALAPIEGTVAPLSSVDPAGAYAIETADGGAIAVGVVRSTLSLQIPGEKEGQSFTLAAYFAALGAGSTTVTTAAEIDFAQPVALAIPPAGAGAPMSVLGVSQVPIKATTQ